MHISINIVTQTLSSPETFYFDTFIPELDSLAESSVYADSSSLLRYLFIHNQRFKQSTSLLDIKQISFSWKT